MKSLEDINHSKTVAVLRNITVALITVTELSEAVHYYYSLPITIAILAYITILSSYSPKYRETLTHTLLLIVFLLLITKTSQGNGDIGTYVLIGLIGIDMFVTLMSTVNTIEPDTTKHALKDIPSENV